MFKIYQNSKPAVILPKLKDSNTKLMNAMKTKLLNQKYNTHKIDSRFSQPFTDSNFIYLKLVRNRS